MTRPATPAVAVVKYTAVHHKQEEYQMNNVYRLCLSLTLALAAPAALATPPKCTADSDFGFSPDKAWFCCGKAGNDPVTQQALFTAAKIYCNQGCVSSFVIDKKKVEWKDVASIDVRMLPAHGGANGDAQVIIDNHHALWAACALGKIIKPVGLDKTLKMPSNFAGGCANTKKLSGDKDTWSAFNLCLGLAPPKEAGDAKPQSVGVGPNACSTSADCAGHPKAWTKCCTGTKINQCRAEGYSPCAKL